jgi:hypothetical protein
VSIADRLKVYEGTKYDVGTAPGDAESSSLLTNIEEALEISKWSEVAWASGGIVLTRSNKPAGGWSLLQTLLSLYSRNSS